jgi:hypothetical protein
MRADNRQALNIATRHRTEVTRERARAALRHLDANGSVVTFTAVAAVADVSRSLLYRDPELRAEIDRLRTRGPHGQNRPPAAERASEASLHQRLATALEDNRSLRQENQLLREQVAVLLGQQRATTTPTRPRTRTIGPCS